MKMQTTNETLLSEAINSSVDYADWSAAVVEDPAAAHGSFRRAEYDRVLPLCGRAAADASHTAALLSSRGATAFPGTRNRGALARPRRQQPRTGKYSARVDRVYSFDDWRDHNLLGHGRHECLADRGWIPPHNAWRSLARVDYWR